MIVYVLMETDTDIDRPTVSVWQNRNDAIECALYDIAANGSHEILYENDDGKTWYRLHKSELMGENLSIITTEEVRETWEADGDTAATRK